MEWPSTRVSRAKQLNSTTAASTQPITSWSHSYSPAPGRRAFFSSPAASSGTWGPSGRGWSCRGR